MLKGNLCLFHTFAKQINVSSLVSHPFEQNMYDRLRVPKNILLRRKLGRRQSRWGETEKCDNDSCYGCIASVLSKFLLLT